MNANAFEQEPPPRTRRGDPERSRTGLWIGLLVVLPALYVLSVGPMVWVFNQFQLDSLATALEMFYAPLGLLVHYDVPGIAPALEWYVELFID